MRISYDRLFSGTLSSDISHPRSRWTSNVATCGLAGIVAVLAMASAAPAYADSKPQPLVTTMTPKRAPMARQVVGYGQVGASEADLSILTVPYPVSVQRLFVQAGQSVSAGTPLFATTPDPAALLAAQQARSGVDFAKQEYERTRALFTQHLATASQLATAQKTLSDAQQAYTAQQQPGLTTGTTIVKASGNGVVTIVSVAQGARIAAGSPIMQLSLASKPGSSQPNVLLQIEPDDIAGIHAGDQAKIDGLSTSLAGADMQGVVTKVGAALDPTTRLIAVGVNASLTGTPYLPGTAVRVVIQPTGGGAAHWIVPRNAVQGVDSSNAQGIAAPAPYIFQIDAGHVAHRVPVHIAVETDQQYGVDGKIDPALPVIVDGSYVVQDGDTVRIADVSKPASTGTPLASAGNGAVR